MLYLNTFMSIEKIHRHAPPGFAPYKSFTTSALESICERFQNKAQRKNDNFSHFQKQVHITKTFGLDGQGINLIYHAT